MSLLLDIDIPGKPTQRLSIEKSMLTVGRSNGATIVLPHQQVSSRHLCLKVYSTGVTVEDLGSSNGTFLDGRLIQDSVQIYDNQSLQLGPQGPRITILKGAGSSTTSTKKVNGESRIGLWSGLAICALLFVIASGTGVLFLFYKPISYAIYGRYVSAESDVYGLKHAVGMVYCGFTILGLDGKRADEPAALALLGKEGISKENIQYANNFVQENEMYIHEIEGQKFLFHALSGGTGTGFLVNRNGYVITNRHVIESHLKLSNATEKLLAFAKLSGASRIEPKLWVFFDSVPCAAEIVYVSKKADLAVLKCDDAPSKAFFVLSRSQRLDRGDSVSAVGFPGIVKDINKEIAGELGKGEDLVKPNGSVESQFSKKDLEYYQTYGQINSIGAASVIHHSAKINQGNSGGPLINSAGLVVGINTWVSQGADVNVSQSINELRKEIDQNVPDVIWAR